MDAFGAADARATMFRRRPRTRRPLAVCFVPTAGAACARPGAALPGCASYETRPGRGVLALLVSASLHLAAFGALVALARPAALVPSLAPVPIRWLVVAEPVAVAPPASAQPRPTPAARSHSAPLPAPTAPALEVSPAAASPVPAVAAAPPADPSPGAPAPAALPRAGHQVAPHYPRAARLRGAEGTALLRVRIGPDGRVAELDLERSSGHADLDRAALRAVARWRFEPVGASGTWVRIPVEFRLEPTRPDEES
jgi:protein TonB